MAHWIGALACAAAAAFASQGKGRNLPLASLLAGGALVLGWTGHKTSLSANNSLERDPQLSNGDTEKNCDVKPEHLKELHLKLDKDSKQAEATEVLRVPAEEEILEIKLDSVTRLEVSSKNPGGDDTSTLSVLDSVSHLDISNNDVKASSGTPEVPIVSSSEGDKHNENRIVGVEHSDHLSNLPPGSSSPEMEGFGENSTDSEEEEFSETRVDLKKLKDPQQEDTSACTSACKDVQVNAFAAPNEKGSPKQHVDFPGGTYAEVRKHGDHTKSSVDETEETVGREENIEKMAELLQAPTDPKEVPTADGETAELFEENSATQSEVEDKVADASVPASASSDGESFLETDVTRMDATQSGVYCCDKKNAMTKSVASMRTLSRNSPDSVPGENCELSNGDPKTCDSLGDNFNDRSDESLTEDTTIDIHVSFPNLAASSSNQPTSETVAPEDKVSPRNSLPMVEDMNSLPNFSHDNHNDEHSRSSLTNISFGEPGVGSPSDTASSSTDTKEVMMHTPVRSSTKSESSAYCFSSPPKQVTYDSPVHGIVEPQSPSCMSAVGSCEEDDHTAESNLTTSEASESTPETTTQEYLRMNSSSLAAKAAQDERLRAWDDYIADPKLSPRMKQQFLRAKSALQRFHAGSS